MSCDSHMAQTPCDAASGCAWDVTTGMCMEAVATPAKCNTITGASAISTFCADNGANGLKDTASSIDCVADPCVKADDAVDCCKASSGGGGTGTKAADGASCTANGDCTSDNCNNLICATAGGGGTGTKAADGASCTANGDCTSDNCDIGTGKCASAAGGGTGTLAADGASCTGNGDCTSDNCDTGTGKCATAGGGGTSTLAADGASCTSNGDCTSDNCMGGNCAAGAGAGAGAGTGGTDTSGDTGGGDTGGDTGGDAIPKVCKEESRNKKAPAKCDSITGSSKITAFCADNGANGLIDKASTTKCNTDPCKKYPMNDAKICCKKGIGAKCHTMDGTGLKAFCIAGENGQTGLLKQDDSHKCKADPCTKANDAETCCEKYDVKTKGVHDPNDVDCTVLFPNTAVSKALCKENGKGQWGEVPSHCKEMCTYLELLCGPKNDEDKCTLETGINDKNGDLLGIGLHAMAFPKKQSDRNDNDCKPLGLWLLTQTKMTHFPPGENYIYRAVLPTIETLSKKYIEGGFAPTNIKVLEYVFQSCDRGNGNCANLRGCPVPEGQGTGKIGSMNSWDLSQLSTAHANHLVKLIGDNGGNAVFRSNVGIIENGEKGSEKIDHCKSAFDHFGWSYEALQTGISINTFVEDVSKWDVSKITIFDNMFSYTDEFNSDISKWDVSSAVSMRSMFRGSREFNADISKWDTGALKSTTQLIGIELLSGGTSETTNPLDHMFEHAFMFNRDLSKWKIPTSILWGQNFIGMISMSMDASINKKKYVPVHNSRGDPRPTSKFNQVLCSKPWVDFWERLDNSDTVNDYNYDQTWIDFWKDEALENTLLKSMDGFDSVPKINFFIGTGGTVLCCGKGERLEIRNSDGILSESIPSKAKCVGCEVGQYQDSEFVKPEKCNTCPIGYAATTSTEPCSMCAAGLYMDDAPDKRKAFGCKNCLPGKSSKPGASKCTCPAEFYLLNATSEDCIPCKGSMNCSEAGMYLETIETMPGYWRQHNKTDVFYSCKDQENCIGGVISEQCEEKRGSMLCEVCFDGHTKVGSDCIACPPGQGRGAGDNGTVGAIVQTLIPCVLLFFGLIVFFARIKNVSKDDKNKEKSTKIAPINKVIKDEDDTKNTLEKDYQNVQAGPENKGNGKEETETATPKTTLFETQLTGATIAIAGVVAGVVAEEEEEQKQSSLATAIETGTGVILDEVEGAIAGDEGEITNGAGKNENKQKRVRQVQKQLENIAPSLAGRLRIMIGFLQIQAALVFSFSIPWPPIFSSLLINLTFINIDFSPIFAGMSPCALHTPFMVSAAAHMFLLPAVIIIILAASIVAKICLRKNNVSAKAKTLLLEVSLFMYPGIAAKCFTAMKCQKVGEHSYLVADFGVQCWVDDHASIFLSIILPAMFLIVIGLPIFLSVFLSCNKKKIYNSNEKFIDTYGNVFEAYEQKYYWFESIILIQKALLTGGLVLVAPGSSAQIFIGLLVAFAFFTIIVKTMPYEEDGEDTMQTIATASTVLTLMIGLVLKTSSETAMAAASANGEISPGGYDALIMDIILIMLFSCVSLMCLWMTILSLPCFA